MKRLIILVTLLAAGALSIAAAGYQQPSQGLPAAALAATQIEKVKDNLYMITGADPTDRNSFSGGNTGVFITDNGVVVCPRVKMPPESAVITGYPEACASNRSAARPPHPVWPTRSAIAVCHCAI